MRPVNDERAIVQYVRIHRIVDPGMFADTVGDFGNDLFDVLTYALDLSGSWRNRSWRIGDVDRRPPDGPEISALSARFGWADEISSADVPPAYNDKTHSWIDESPEVREGVLSLFVVESASQVAGVTSLAGDVPLPGFCHALTDLLNQAELQAVAGAEEFRAKREWLVEEIIERGSFDAWVNEVSLVTKVSATFHRPNPRTTDEIVPVVSLLNDLKATSATVTVSGKDGLDPYGHEIMRGAIAMQENDYGKITAQGFLPNGKPDAYKSSEHPASDVVASDPEDPSLSRAGVVVVVLEALLKRLQQGLR